MKNYTLLLLIAIFFASCEKYDEAVLPLVGVYEANVLNVAGPFSLSISVAHDDNIMIEALFDGENWEIIEADVDHLEDTVKEINLYSTEVAPNVVIKGEGFYLNDNIQLDYSISIDGHETDYTIVASKR